MVNKVKINGRSFNKKSMKKFKEANIFKKYDTEEDKNISRRKLLIEEYKNIIKNKKENKNKIPDNEPVEIEQFVFEYNGKSYTIQDMLKLNLEERQVIQDAMNIKIDEKFDLVEAYKVYDYMPKDVKDFCDLVLENFEQSKNHVTCYKPTETDYVYSLSSDYVGVLIKSIILETKINYTAEIVKYLLDKNPYTKIWIDTYKNDSF